MVTHCFVLRREGRRLQLFPHRRPRDHWPLMIRANLELLYGGVTKAPRDAVAWDFDAIMPALRDPDRHGVLRTRTPLWKLLRQVRLKKGGHRWPMPCTRWQGPNFNAPLRRCPPRSRMRRFEDGKLSVIDNLAGKCWPRRTIRTHCWLWHGQPGLQCTN